MCTHRSDEECFNSARSLHRTNGDPPVRQVEVVSGLSWLLVVPRRRSPRRVEHNIAATDLDLTTEDLRPGSAEITTWD